ncbi:MAG: stable inheritance protein KleA [Betaproteobacteria bacterium]
MNSAPPFLTWIGLLANLHPATRAERERLRGLAHEALRFEARALALREELGRGRTALEEHIAQHYGAEQIGHAKERAGAADLPAQLRAGIDDPMLRGALAGMDEYQLGAEAVLAFYRGRVLRQHNLMSTATDAERLATLGRVLDWANTAARPVADRLRE